MQQDTANIRLYLVDDEILSMQYFKLLLQGYEKEYEIVGETTNGAQAYEEILGLQPDMVFIDISMPVMNGLELAEKLLAKMQGLKIILLTSYRDFEYAKRGIEIGVCAYMLKHELSTPKLIEEIKRQTKDLQLEKERAYRYTKKNLELFLHSNTPEQEVEYVYKEGYQFALLDLVEHRPLSFAEQEQKPTILNSLPLEQADYPEQVLCRSVVQMGESHWCALIFLRDTASRQKLRAELYQTAQELQRRLIQQGIFASLLISPQTHSFYDLPQMYQAFHPYRRMLFFLGKNKIAFQAELPQPNEEPLQADRYFHAMMEHLRREEKEQVYEQMVQLVQAAVAQGTVRLFWRTMQELLTTLQYYCREVKIPFPAKVEKTSFDDVEKVEMWFRELLEEIFLFRHTHTGYSEKVRDALCFMQEHYRENLSLEDIAKNCFISERYLRKLFREELNVSPVDWLTQYRMETAKKLISSQQYKIVEIYQMVGFASSQYFSSVFKKYTGCSPSEYARHLSDRAGGAQ